MSKIDALNNNNNYYINGFSNNNTPRYAVSYTGGLDSDVYEGSSSSKTKKVVGGLIGLATLTAGALWLWKGKGWSKIQEFISKFRKSVKPDKQPVSNPKANETIRRNNKKAPQGVSHEQAMEKVQNSINSPGYVKRENPDVIIRNTETENTNAATRKLVERAKADSVTPEDVTAYAKAHAYRAPNKEQAEVMARVNSEAAEKTAEAHRIGNLVPEAQAKALANTGKTVSKKVKNGTYLSNDGYTLTYNNGNIEKIVTPDGRTITKPKTICKYEQKIDMNKLKQCVRNAA